MNVHDTCYAVWRNCGHGFSPALFFCLTNKDTVLGGAMLPKCLASYPSPNLPLAKMFPLLKR